MAEIVSVRSRKATRVTATEGGGDGGKVAHSGGKRKGKKKDAQIEYLSPDEIVAKLEDNPRFQVDGLSPAQVADDYFKSDEFSALCHTLDAAGGPDVPLVVEEIGNGKFLLLDGWCRHEWAKRRARKRKDVRLPVVVQDIEDDRHRKTVRIQLNTARKSYAPLAQARAFADMVKAWGSITMAAKQMGVPSQKIKQRLSLLLLPEGFQALIATKQITVMGADMIQSLPGYAAYVKCREYHTEDNAPEPTEEELEKAERIEKFMNHVVDVVNSDESSKYTHSDVSALWNDWLDGKGRTLKKGKGKKGKVVEKIDPTQIMTAAVTDEEVRTVMKHYGSILAAEYRRSKPRTSVVDTTRSLMEHIGFVMGWCVPTEVAQLLTSANGHVKMAEGTAQALNELAIRDFMCQAVRDQMLEDGLDIKDEEDPILTEDGWQDFVKRDIPYTNMLQELEDRYE